MTYRVIQWSTGNVGHHATRLIANHPELELVGLWVHSPDKVGKDAGELVGIEPLGVAATNDIDELLSLGADCVCYTATADLRPTEAIDDMARILASGTNVVSSSVVPLIYPGHLALDMRRPLEDACIEGGTSCFTSGIDPGFANDLLPLVLTGTCEYVNTVRVMEIVNYDTYAQPEVLFGTMGFGRSLEDTPLLLTPGVLSFAWGGVVKAIAAGLGVEVTELREVHERVPATERLDLGFGVIEVGTTAGIRFEVQGIVNGEAKIILEHVTRLHDDIAPDWPQPAGLSGYRVIVTGNPNYTLDLQMMGDDGDHNTAGLVGTAGRIVNSIPAVCAARPGLLSVLDLPLVSGQGTMRP
ncbi:putative dihydrodipicolinate reductase-like protein [Actinobacteria bacterium IMCC26207]|nr:putative dihydrodipicolinate reductase-like protein [Actinobacteria bacterium IMCC26207]